MSKPEGIIKKTKDNSRKKHREAKEWDERKRLGRPKQVWVGSTLRGAPFVPNTMDEIEHALTEETIKDYVQAHWEKI